jgi:2-oxoglutarate dehydrogenase E1 component
VFVPEERVWLRHAVETCRFRPPHDPINAVDLLDRITQVEAFERFLHRTFPGKTRFSIEGLDMMIPILDEIINDAAAAGVQHVMIAMAHRGRLNVLAHILQKPYAQVLAEFKDPLFTRSARIDLGWMGDVKYHAGARYVERWRRPSRIAHHQHAAQSESPRSGRSGDGRHGPRRRHRRGAPRRPTCIRKRVLGILIHGDCRLPGPGRGGRDAEPVATRRLRRRRHDPHHREQPARVHGDTGGVVQHELRQRARARLQDSHRARQRRRSGGLHRGGAARVGVPHTVSSSTS